MDSQSEKLARVAMLSSVTVAVLILARSIVNLISLGDLAALLGVDPTVSYVQTIAVTILVLLIPYYGYTGAKNSNTQMLNTASCCSAVCLAFAAFGLVTAFIEIPSFSVPCTTISALGLDPFVPPCFIIAGLNVALIIGFAISCYTTFQLSSRSQVYELGSPHIQTIEV